MQTDTTGIKATEFYGDTREAVANALAGDFTLQPMAETEEQRTKRLLTSPYVLSLRNAAERRCIESERIKADLAINRMKNSGEMLRREIDRVRTAEMNAGVHQ
jgi:hypothetical protein